MKTHRFDALSFASGLVAVAAGLIFLVPAEPTDLVDVVTGIGNWLLAALFLTIGIAVLAPVILRQKNDSSDD